MDAAPSMLEAALEYAELGLNVVPLHGVNDGTCTCGSPSCGKPGKHPRIRWRDLKSKPLTSDQIEEIWTRWPDSNVGVITGRISDVAVLDIDGSEGVAALEAHGLPLTDLPSTPTVETGGGGFHYYYRMPEADTGVKTSAAVLDHVDIRAEGGLAVLPPSMHASGRRYEWQEGRSIHDLDFGDFDFSLLSAEDREPVGPQRRRWFEKILAGVSHGSRNDMAAKLAGRYFGLGMGETEVFFLLRGWNSYNDPPIPLPELRRTIESIRDAEGEDQQDQKDLIEQISDILKVKLESVKRITGDDPKILLEFNEGTVMLTMTKLLSPKGFQQAVAEATKVVVRKLGSRSVPTHDRLAQMILLASEDIDAGEEATGTGELVIMINEYIESQISLPVIADEAPLRGAFIYDGRAWISATDLVQRAAAKWGTRPSLTATAQMMRAIGMVRHTFRTPGGGSRTMWGIELGRVPFVKTQVEASHDQARQAS